MDPLSQLVGSLQVTSAIYTRFEATAPWGHRVAHPGQIKFVLVTRGSCWVRTDALPEPLELAPGDLFLVLDGAPYSVSERPTSRCIDCARLEAQREGFLIRYGGGGATTELVSVALQLSPDDAGTLVAALPAFIHLRTSPQRSHSLHALTELLRDEIQEQLGSTPIVRRLAEALFISAVRFYVENASATHGLLSAIADPHLRRALGAMHEDLAHPWTVEGLAARAGMSRASFAAKFRAKAGLAPLDYLTRQRIAAARALLREDLAIAEVATRVGYASPISFARAFGRIAGMTPGASRRRGDPAVGARRT